MERLVVVELKGLKKIIELPFCGRTNMISFSLDLKISRVAIYVSPPYSLCLINPFLGTGKISSCFWFSNVA